MFISNVSAGICILVLIVSKCVYGEALDIQYYPEGNLIRSVAFNYENGFLDGGRVPGTNPLFNCIDPGAWNGPQRICDGDVLSKIPIRCTINGEASPLQLDRNFSVTMRWSNGTEIESGDTFAPSGIGIVVPFLHFSSGAGVAYTGPTELFVDCSADLTQTDSLIFEYGSSTPSPGFVRRVTGVTKIINYYGVIIAQPSHVVGRINETIDMPFSIKLIDRQARGLTWDVGEPCSGWNPSLMVSGGDLVTGRILPDSGQSASISPEAEYVLTATFTPIHAGDFQCIGTLTLTGD